MQPVTQPSQTQHPSAAAQATEVNSFQSQVQSWLADCPGQDGTKDVRHHAYRVLEEALELGQALRISKQEALQLVDCAFARPCGDASVQVGGVMLSLAALCAVKGVDLMEAAHRELTRVSSPENLPHIRTSTTADSPPPGEVSVGATETPPSQSQISQGWKVFDPRNPPKDGVYWALVSDPCYDVDVDDQGKTVGFPTGEIATSVVMVRFDGMTGDGPDFSTVDHYLFGEISDESCVVALMAVSVPDEPSMLPVQTEQG